MSPSFEEIYQTVYEHHVVPTEHLLDTYIVLCACGQRFWSLKSHSKHVAETLMLEFIPEQKDGK
jgi:hypothetical protein